MPSVKTWWRLAVVSAVSLVILGCTKSDPLVGTWRDERGGGLITLRGDGSYVITSSTPQGSEDRFGTYRNEGQRLIFRQYHGSPRTDIFPLEIIAVGESEMNLRSGLGGRVEHFVRVSRSPAPVSAEEALARTPEGMAANRKKDEDSWARITDRAILNNVRQLAAAADQYYLENAVTTVSRDGLIGPNAYMNGLNKVEQEEYPLYFTQGITITVTGVGGARTITYAP